MLEFFKTEIQFHFYYTLALLVVGILIKSNSSKSLKWVGNLLIVGLSLFSSVRYIIVISNHCDLNEIPAFVGLTIVSG